jgi:hypothetical protein
MAYIDFEHSQKVKIFPLPAMKTYRGSRGIAPLFLNLGCRCRWVVNFTLQPLFPRKELNSVECQMGHRASLDVL